MSNSSLINKTILSPHYKTTTTKKDTITIHCMAGNLSIETCGNVFRGTTKASSNYGIGSDGRIALYVNEKDRSMATSSASNDNRAITIEVANDGGADTGWHVSDKAYESLIKLCADICKRNNIKELKWKADKSLIGQIDKQNMTVHRWFANKSCPGDYLYSKHSDIAKRVNELLNPVIEDVPTALNKLKQLGIITGIEYWSSVCDCIFNVNYLIIKSANKVKEAVNMEEFTLQTALDKLVEKGVISSPEYWVKCAGCVKYLETLIINMAKHL